jgi:hypothetical protein
MLNLFDELFLYGDSGYKRYLTDKKIHWKHSVLYLFFGAITAGLVTVGIFFSAFFDSIVSVLVLAVLAVMSAIDYKK